MMRTVLNLATALDDPEAWEDPESFILRPMEVYKEKVGVAWAQFSKSANGISRNCPGQTLSITMMSVFYTKMQALQRKGWSVSKPIKFVKVEKGHYTPYP